MGVAIENQVATPLILVEHIAFFLLYLSYIVQGEEVLRVLDEDIEHILIGRKGNDLGEGKKEGEEKSKRFGYLTQPFLQGIRDILEVEDHQGSGKDGEEGDMANRLEGEMESEDAEDELYNPYSGDEEKGKEKGEDEHLKRQHIKPMEIGGEPFHDNILDLLPAEETQGMLIEMPAVRVSECQDKG